MPTASNRFQILNLHPKKHVFNPRTQTLFKPTPSQTLGENHPIFGQIKIHSYLQSSFNQSTKNI